MSAVLKHELGKVVIDHPRHIRAAGAADDGRQFFIKIRVAFRHRRTIHRYFPETSLIGDGQFLFPLDGFCGENLPLLQRRCDGLHLHTEESHFTENFSTRASPDLTVVVRRDLLVFVLAGIRRSDRPHAADKLFRVGLIVQNLHSVFEREDPDAFERVRFGSVDDP